MTHELKRARKALLELERLLKSLPVDPSPSAVHTLRTTTRRVEAIAAAVRPGHEKRSKRLLKSIGAVRKAAGGVRDMDVLLADTRRLARYSAGSALTQLLERLRNARLTKAQKLKDTLKRRGDTARTELKHYTKLVRDALTEAKVEADGDGMAADGMAAARPETLRSAVGTIAQDLSLEPALSAENVHAFRIKIKKLRYILQLTPNTDPALIEALSAAQHSIGDWHDWQQLQAIAQEVLAGEGDRALLERIERIEAKKLERALAAANALRGRYLAPPLASGI